MASHLFDLAGKVAVVTGSSRGIGKAIAAQMAAAGARVVISSRKADACDRVAAAIRDGGGEAIAAPANISDKAQLEQLVARVMDHWGGIDVLVCNAAVNPHFGPSADISDDAFDKILSSNIKSNHWLCQLVLPRMAERRSGSIIIVSSAGGLVGSHMLGAYCISKAADMQLARNLAVEWGDRGVRVNCIAPGLIRTDFARALWEDATRLEGFTRGSALKRIGEPDEIAGAAVFLASAAGAFVTGQTLVIDGGASVAYSSV
jgi:NAD(P)-dependent dehydrogenase (short-subunit alcohol dehydrogenase family)